MKIHTILLSLLGLSTLPCLGATDRPSQLPKRYRDFAIYTTSKPDPTNPALIEMSVQLVNRGQRILRTRVELSPQQKLGFKGGSTDVDLAAGQMKTWQLTFHPPDDLVKEVIEGAIFFNSTRARDLVIAVRGPDPKGWKPDREPEVDDPSETLVITDRAQVVATYAPRVRIDWWQRHPSSTVTADQRVGPTVTLAAQGRTDYAILVDVPEAEERENANFQGAVADLVRCIRIISGGAELPVVVSPEQNQRAIRLRFNDQSQWSHPDAYHLYTTSGSDVIIESGHVDGLRNGIYGLLTDHLDCHWFVPGMLGEEIPQPNNQAAVIGQIDQRRSPAFYSAAHTNWGGGNWNIRNRNVARRGRIMYGHAFATLLKGTPELYEQHPEWWARDRAGTIRHFDQAGGWSFTNFCTTNPEVLELVAQKINDQLRSPNAILASIDPNDLAPFCLCESCRAVDASYGADNPDGRFSTDRMLHFANEIHRRLDPEHQDKQLGFLVYGYQIELPKTAQPGPGVTGTICYMDWDYDHTRPMNDPTSPSNRKFLRLIKGWGKLLPMMGYYDYPTDYVHFAPYGQVAKLREDIPLVHDLGVTCMVIEGQPILATNALNLYICSRLQYDVNEDVDVLVEEFIHKFHGPAAEPMRKYWLAAEYYTATLRPGPRAQDRMTRIPAMWEELDDCLKEAETLVANLPENQKRFRDRIAFQRDGFELARQKCAIRDLVYTRQKAVKPGALTAENRQRAENYQKWITTTRKRHAADEEYWSSLLPAYYYSGLSNFVGRVLKEFDAAGVPGASN
ncbi:MAG: DUF4838 domain-containing protein [Pirellulales bacterium]|nr:DUF4838 domain-containing protein [Pirellulales bacterium]